MANNGPNVDLYDERHRNISLKLLRMFNESDQKANLIMSPYSIDRVLLVAYFGAANKTKQSLEQLLCLDTADKQARFTWKRSQFVSPGNGSTCWPRFCVS